MLRELSLSYVITCLYFFLSGVEYAVILPTLNKYLLSLDAETYFIGLVMSSFSFTGLISAPIYGRVTDITGSTKTAVIVSNLFEIGGNFMYFAAQSPFMVLGSRLVAGIGSGSGSSIFGMIAKSSTKEERTAVFSRLMSLRQIGLIVGPTFNLFLRKLDFYIGPFHVDSFTVPGLFMAILWSLHEILMLFFYREWFTKKESDYDRTITNSDTSTNQSSNENSTPAHKVVSNDDSKPTPTFLSYFLNDVLREEVIVCLWVNFTLMFVQSGIETLLTPLTLLFFGWGELENSIYFSVAGVLIVVSFLVVALISKKVSDRFMLTCACAVMVGIYVVFLLMMIFASNQPPNTTWVLVIFVIFSVVLVVDLPFVWAPQTSLFSKITSERNQAFNQGIRLLVMGVGQILGPLWAISFMQRLWIMASVNLGLVILLLAMVLLSYKRLESSSSPGTNSGSPTEEDPSENTPLLSSSRAQAVNA